MESTQPILRIYHQNSQNLQPAQLFQWPSLDKFGDKEYITARGINLGKLVRKQEGRAASNGRDAEIFVAGIGIVPH